MNKMNKFFSRVKRSKIKKGDKVKILSGNEKDKQAVVERIDAKKGLAYLPGINVHKKHVKRQGQTQGGIIDIIKPLKLSNLMLICPNCQRETRVGFKLEGNSKVRVCKKCKQEIKS